jgi:hypothetical protein
MGPTRRYRIYTELKNLDRIEEILNKAFTGYTMYPAKGVWKGVSERSLVIEIIETCAGPRVFETARLIAVANQQEAVFVTRENIAAELIEIPRKEGENG